MAIALVKQLIEAGAWVQWDSKVGVVKGKVTAVVTDGKVPDIAVEVEGTETEPAVQAEVYRLNGDKWEASGVLVGKKVSDLAEIEALVAAAVPTVKDASGLFPNARMMLGFWLPRDVAEAIAVTDGEPPENLHLTLAYYGKVEQVPNIDDLFNDLTDYCNNTLPIAGKIGGVGRFNANENTEDQDVVYAVLDAPTLLPFRQGLLAIAAKYGLSINAAHGYTPHVTLAYVSSDAELDVKLETKELTLDRVTLAIEDNHFTFSLNGLSGTGQLSSAAALEDLFKHSVSDRAELRDFVNAATPAVTEEQLKKINRFTPANLEPLQAHEVVVVTFIASDNLLNRGLGKWREKDLITLSRLSPGLPFTLDHDWEEVSKTQGLIFDSRILKYDSAPKEVLDRAGNLAWNRKVVAVEGYIEHEIDVAFPANSPALHGLRFGLLNPVSLGGFNYRDHVCPLCNTSFDDDSCPHGIPMPMYGLTHEVDNRIAPYYVRDGVFDLGECSLVTIANLPLAGVKRRGNGS